MALALADKYNSLPITGCFTDPLREDSSILNDPCIDLAINSSCFTVPPGIEVGTPLHMYTHTYNMYIYNNYIYIYIYIYVYIYMYVYIHLLLNYTAS